MDLFDADGFVARASYGESMSNGLVAAIGISNVIIAICHVVIPILGAMLFKAHASRGSNPRFGARDVCVCAAFVLTCGATHIVDATMFIVPMYRLDAAALVLCASCSATAAAWLVWRVARES